MDKKEWFELWFNSPYYHVLYKHRNDKEAQLFIDNLLAKFQPKSNASILDLACGKGRHSAYLAQKAYEIIGIDLSENSIFEANKNYVAPNLEFYIHDMREPFRINYFDYVFNFFTSFGYFDNTNDNISTLKSIYKGLKQDGILLIDFMNAEKVMNNIVEREEKEIDGVHFYIRREIVEDRIVKHIKFDADGKVFSYSEKVQALMPHHFHSFLHKTKFKIIEEMGDYNLSAFDSQLSDRYIVMAKKMQ